MCGGGQFETKAVPPSVHDNRSPQDESRVPVGECGFNRHVSVICRSHFRSDLAIAGVSSNEAAYSSRQNL